MKQYFTSILVCLAFISTVRGQTNHKTILGIFPHPDDELIIGSVLAKYARLGDNVYIIIATDGKDGTRVTKIPSGDSLGAVRQKESICAFQKLGIHPPIFFHIDRLDTKFGTRPFLNGRRKMIEALKNQIEALKPDILIAFGPDGEYGHSEHIVTGAIVTELLLKEGWVDKYPLYHPVDVEEDVMDNNELSYVDKSYINLAIEYSDEDEKRAIEAQKCYVSQFTTAEIEEAAELMRKDEKNTKYFRKFGVLQGIKSDF